MTYKTLMAHLDLGRSSEHLLRLTASLATRLGADVIGVAAAQPIQILNGQMYVAGELVQLDRDQIDREAAAAEAQLRAALAGVGRNVDWRVATTLAPLADFICAQARAADLVITSPDIGGLPFESNRRTSIGDLVLRIGRPVLIVPPTVDCLDLTSVVVAWKDTRESRRALADALPLLAHAEKLCVAEVAREEDLAGAEARTADVAHWLEGHGIAAEPLAPHEKGDVADQLHAIAEERGAGLIVAGAYGHTRLREWVFGGVTRQVLMHPRRCTLVSH
jgi:nucleotide-binding universal stress UspA family protein